MEPLVKKILNYISIENTKELFNCIKPDFSNLDEVYQNNLNQWFYNNSDKKEIKDIHYSLRGFVKSLKNP